MTIAPTPDDLMTALRARDREAVNETARQMLQHRSQLDDQWFSVAQVLVRNGEISLAVAAAELAAEQLGDTPKSHFQLAAILAMVGRQREAMDRIGAIPVDQSGSIERDHFLGTCAMETGDFELAREAFDRVVSKFRGSGATWLSIAALPAADDEALLTRLEGVKLAFQAATADARARWHYAKGMVLDRLDRSDEAFAEFAAGADLVRIDRSFDSRADREEVDMLVESFTRTAFSEFEGQGGASARPILVVGLPRSGTTLVEEILTRHSSIAGGGELPFASIVRREVGGNTSTQLKAYAAKNDIDRLTELYLHLGDEQFGKGQRFVDKCLGNSRDLGLLASILPDARIIWMRRDPLDCAWSCFRTYFTQGITWSWSLPDIAAHFSAEDKLYAHWSDVLGERILTMSYEDLVKDTESQTKRLLDHVGLDPDEGESLKKPGRPVLTASVTQVREPVYQRSVGAADRYRQHLKPFADAYGLGIRADRVG